MSNAKTGNSETVLRCIARACCRSRSARVFCWSGRPLGNLAVRRQPRPPPGARWIEALGKENYPEAKQKADAVLQGGTPEDRQKTTAVYGRILLGLGQKDQARQYLNTFSGGEKGPGRKGRAAPAAPTAEWRSMPCG